MIHSKHSGPKRRGNIWSVKYMFDVIFGKVLYRPEEALRYTSIANWIRKHFLEVNYIHAVCRRDMAKMEHMQNVKTFIAIHSKSSVFLSNRSRYLRSLCTFCSRIACRYVNDVF